MTDPIDNLLLLAIKRGGPCCLSELIRSMRLVSAVTPAEVHDKLNSLIQSGHIMLTIEGVYRISTAVDFAIRSKQST